MGKSALPLDIYIYREREREKERERERVESLKRECEQKNAMNGVGYTCEAGQTSKAG